VPVREGRHRGNGAGGHTGQVRWWPGPPPRRRTAATVGLAAATALLGAAALTLLLVLPSLRQAVDGGAPLVLAPLGTVTTTEVPEPAEVRATALLIPDLAVYSELDEVGVDAAGALVPPADPAVAGWFSASSVPGDPGPSVIVGHVDSRAGPGVFFGLGDLDVGARIEVRRSDGRTVDFRVVDVYDVPKSEFPTERVYGPVPGPELRLITCGGEFDRAARSYLRNVVVTAVPVSP
jgi:hypothetical protein